MFGNLTGWHLLIIVGVVVLLFGAAKLPALAKSVGQSARIFKGEMKSLNEENQSDTAELATSVENSGTAAPDTSAVARR